MPLAGKLMRIALTAIIAEKTVPPFFKISIIPSGNAINAHMKSFLDIHFTAKPKGNEIAGDETKLIKVIALMGICRQSIDYILY